ncbi:MAG: hypothetical protein HC842_02350 [Cytophagales bacterium]|nr:hypothetical protein [Cytophagales bacterium]
MDRPADYFKGKGAQINTKNPFAQQDVSYDDDPYSGTLAAKPRTQVFYEKAKNLVNAVESPDLGMMYSANPYQGCEHGCSYCYARNVHEYWGFSAGLDFESKIIAKPNASQLLEKYMMRRGYRVQPISFSGNTDCYQPLERQLGLTKACLQVCQRLPPPCGYHHQKPTHFAR